MANRNITLSLPEDLIRKAKVHAAAHDTSINNVVRGLLEHLVQSESESRKAAERLIALARQGPWFDADPGRLKREDLYERK